MILYTFGSQMVECPGQVDWDRVGVWPFAATPSLGAWPNNADIPLGYDERDAKGV